MYNTSLHNILVGFGHLASRLVGWYGHECGCSAAIGGIANNVTVHAWLRRHRHGRRRLAYEGAR